MKPLSALLFGPAVLATAGVCLLAGACASRETPPARPNIVLIVADDAGYGDIGAYGQTKFRTPHIDRLAADGRRFTSFYAGSTVCAPSRCSLMTGLHTGHTHIRGNSEVKPEGQLPIPPETLTVAEVLREAGYTTGAVGKWGLGSPGSAGEPNRQGFDYWFGYLCQRQAHSFYPDHLWENGQRVELDGRTWSHDLLTEKALAFIREHAGGPFFLYLPYTIPHGRYEVPSDAPYSGEDWPEPMKRFAAMMTRMDADVGRIRALIEELGLAERTLTIFTSDNGPERYYEATLPEFFGSAGPYRGIKRDLYEGGIRVPFIAWWPGVVEAGSECREAAAFWDLLPAFAELAGAPRPAGIDGLSIAPLLLGRPMQQQHEHFYWEFHERGGKQAVRWGDWKGVRVDVSRDPGGPVQLYDLAEDPGESRDVAAEHPEVVRRIEELMRESRTPSAEFPFGFETAAR